MEEEEPFPHCLPILSLPILSGRLRPHPTPSKPPAPVPATSFSRLTMTRWGSEEGVQEMRDEEIEEIAFYRHLCPGGCLVPSTLHTLGLPYSLRGLLLGLQMSLDPSVLIPTLPASDLPSPERRQVLAVPCTLMKASIPSWSL